MADQKQATSTEQSTQRTRLRSPNYPMYTLGEAIAKVKTIYQHEKRNFTAASVIQKHLGYKEAGGLGGRALSALKQYGLIEERSDTYGLSEKGFLFTYAEENSPERTAVLRETALKPQIFKELLDMYPSGLPSDATLKAHLIGRKRFNPTAVDNFIRIFRETISLAKVAPGEYTTTQPGEEAGKGNDMEMPSNAVPLPGQPGKPAPSVHLFTWSLSIPRNVRAELRLIGSDLKVEDVRRLKKQIEALEESFRDSEVE